MEKAAEVCKEGPGSQVETAELYRQAAKYYAEAGRAQTSGESLCRGAKVVEEKDPVVSTKNQHTRIVCSLSLVCNVQRPRPVPGHRCCRCMQCRMRSFGKC